MLKRPAQPTFGMTKTGTMSSNNRCRQSDGFIIAGLVTAALKMVCMDSGHENNLSDRDTKHCYRQKYSIT